MAKETKEHPDPIGSELGCIAAARMLVHEWVVR